MFNRLFVFIFGAVAVICSTSAGAQDIQPIQPRDLDGNPATIEAYYYLPGDITWLKSSNQGRSETFGLLRAGDPLDGARLNLEGRMPSSSLIRYFQGMNEDRYFGRNEWRLPKADPGCHEAVSATTEATRDSCPDEVGAFTSTLAELYNGVENGPFDHFSNTWSHWVTTDENDRFIYSFSGDGELQECEFGRCGDHYVWPVHNGDIGVGPQQCIDADGDGWGWNGLASCLIANTDSTQCIDATLVGDGWGWTGEHSCRIPVPEPVCIDTAPEGDGWGWDGEKSCTVFQVPDVYRCDDVGTYPWGWNPTVNRSCWLDLIDTPDFPANVSGTPELPEVAVDEIVDVTLICKRLVEVYYCNCDNSFTDNLSDPQEYDDIFYTATLRELNQAAEVRDESYQTLTVQGTGQDRWFNEVPLYRTDGVNTLRFAPSPGQSTPFFGSLTYYQSGQGDIFMEQSSLLTGGNDITALSHCVVR